MNSHKINRIWKGIGMKQEIGRKRQNIKKIVKKLWFFLPLCLLLSGGYAVYAKYLSQSVQRGITIASSIYFTCNYASPSQTPEDDMTDALVSVAQSTDTDGKEYNFTVEIRNYENILLYNSSTAQIPYTVEFWLADAGTAGDTYQATAKVKTKNADGILEETTETKTITQDNPASFNNILTGGQALSDGYEIKVTAPSGKAVPIYVRVKTADGALLTERLKGKIMLQTRSDAGKFLKSFGFNTNGDTPKEQFEYLQKQSEFNYKITTGGVSQEDGGNTEMVTLYWNGTVYDIDRFSSAWLAWEKSGKKLPKTVTKADLTRYTDWDWTDWDDMDPIYAITVPVNAYASINIGFFRETGYDSRVTSAKAQQNFVYVVKGNQISD